MRKLTYIDGELVSISLKYKTTLLYVIGNIFIDLFPFHLCKKRNRQKMRELKNGN